MKNILNFVQKYFKLVRPYVFFIITLLTVIALGFQITSSARVNINLSSIFSEPTKSTLLDSWEILENNSGPTGTLSKKADAFSVGLKDEVVSMSTERLLKCKSQVPTIGDESQDGLLRQKIREYLQTLDCETERNFIASYSKLNEEYYVTISEDGGENFKNLSVSKDGEVDISKKFQLTDKDEIIDYAANKLVERFGETKTTREIKKEAVRDTIYNKQFRYASNGIVLIIDSKKAGAIGGVTVHEVLIPQSFINTVYNLSE